MMRALGADAEAGREVLVVDDLRAGRALHPETLGNAAFLVRRLYGLAYLLEPGHYVRIPHTTGEPVNSRPVIRPADG